MGPNTRWKPAPLCQGLHHPLTRWT